MLFMRTIERPCPHCGETTKVPSLNGGWAVCVKGHKSAVIRRRGQIWLEKIGHQGSELS